MKQNTNKEENIYNPCSINNKAKRKMREIARSY